MNEQEREHYDHIMGQANEFQNALAVSRLTRKDDDRVRIEDLVAAGRFVVVCETTAYCRFTDAIMGADHWHVGDYATREEAEAYLRGMGDERYNDDAFYHIVPKPTPPPPATHTNDEPPF
jgi:hypothetical protein